MDDVLTARETDEFIRDFVNRLKSNYKKSLLSGAVSEEEFGGRGDHTLLRCVTVLTAEQMHPVSKVGRDALENLRKII